MENGKPWLVDPSTWKNTWRDDWRLMGQEGYLLNKKLQHRHFDSRLGAIDGKCCDFCFTHFETEDILAYYESESDVWICEDCYRHFQEHFFWTVEELE